MKAWYLSIKDGEDQGIFVVFADTATRAKSQADGYDLMYDRYVDIRAIRAKKYDGLEGLSRMELEKTLWRDGWQWVDLHFKDPEEATDEEFYEWYKSIYGDSNVK